MKFLKFLISSIFSILYTLLLQKHIQSHIPNNYKVINKNKMSCNTLCSCISSAWEQYFKILHNMHFYHVIWHHNAFCNIFIWKMSVCVCCDINMLIWTWQQQKFNMMCFALKSNTTCFSNHLLTLFLFLRQYQPKKPHITMSQILVIIYQGLYKNHSFIIRRSCDRIHINEIWIEFGSQSRPWINVKKKKHKKTHTNK